MRAATLAVIVSFVTPALGQIGPIDAVMQKSFDRLRGQTEAMLVLNGTDGFGSRRNVLSSSASFKWDILNPDVSAKVEINDYVNNAHTHRIVGDGTTLWAYDFGRNSFTNFRYGAYSGAQPDGYRGTMFSELASVSQGPTTFLTRILREIFSGPSAQYHPWFPGANVTVVQDAKPEDQMIPGLKDSVETMDDTVVSERSYQGSPTEAYLVYWYAQRPSRSVTFHFRKENGAWSLWMSHAGEKPVSAIYYSDYQKIDGSTLRLLDWEITMIDTSPLPGPPSYIFVPPTTARSIANQKGGG